MVLFFLADGFEEAEAILPIDICRRAGLEVRTVGVTGKTVTGAHGIGVEADCLLDSVMQAEPVAVVLPGGGKGTENLDASAEVRALTQACAQRGGVVAAICAAPSVLGKMGLLRGRKATCFDGFEHFLQGAEVCRCPVVRDGNFITAWGAGAAAEFGFELVKVLCGEEKAVRLHKAMKFS